MELLKRIPFRLSADARLTLLLAAFAFVAVGIPCVFTSTAAHTIFLESIGPAAMSRVYLAQSVLIPIVGSLFLFAESRVSLKALALVGLGIDFLVLAGFGMGIHMHVPYLELPAIVWFEIEVIFNGLVLWGLAGQLMTLRQGKRLFGIISAGEPAAIVIGGLMTPLLLRWLAPGDLFFISAIGVAAGACLVLYISRQFALPERVTVSLADDPDARTRPKDAAPPAPWWRNQYIFAMVALAIVSQVGYFVIDNAFYIEAGNHYPDERALAGFLGVFQAVIGAASVVVSMTVSGPLLRRFGARAGLLTLPVLVLLTSFAVMGASIAGGSASLVVWLLFGNKLIDMTFRYSVDRTCAITLYQPLSPNVRVRAQATMEAIVEPLAAGLAGILLYLLVSRLGFSPIQLTRIVIVVAIIWGTLALLLHSRYVIALRNAVALRRLDRDSVATELADSTDYLRLGLANASGGEALYSLELLAESASGITSDDLAILLRHPDIEVRREAVRRIAERGVEVQPSMLARMESEPSAVVRSELLRAHTLLSSRDIDGDLLSHLDDADEDVLLAAFTGLLTRGGIAGRHAAAERLLHAIASPLPDRRRIAARILGDVGDTNDWRPLLPLMRDDDTRVRTAALIAAGRIKTVECIPALLANLEVAGFERVSAASLVNIGTASLAPLSDLFNQPGTSERTKRNVVTTLTQFGAPAIPVLLPMLAGATRRLRLVILKALVTCRYLASAQEREWFTDQITAELDYASRSLSVWRDCFEHNTTPGATRHRPLQRKELWITLARCCEEEIWRVQESIFMLLAINFPEFDALGAWTHFSRGGAEQRAYALEAIDTLPLGPTREPLMSLLEGERLATKRIRFGRITDPARLTRIDRLVDCALTPETRLLSTTSACAVLSLHEPSTFDPHVTARLRDTQGTLVSETIAVLNARRTQIDGEPTMMMTIEKILLLRTVSIFSSIDTEHLVDLAQSSTPVELKADETLLHEGEYGTTMFVVVSGRVKVHRGERVLAELGAREVVGEMAALDPGPRSASVTAVEDTLLLRIGNNELENLLSENAGISRGIIKVLCQRLRQ